MENCYFLCRRDDEEVFTLSGVSYCERNCVAMRCFIETEPKIQELNEVLEWLKYERNCDKSGKGFYNNKNIIEEAYENNNLIIFRRGSESIGLITWSACENIRIDIDIFVIHPSYRGQGYGALFYDAVSEVFRDRGFIAVKLFCEPSTSESFWKKMGLLKFPDCEYTEHKLTYYGVLVDTATTAYIHNADKIELWDVEPYEAEETNPKWTWYIEMQGNRLLYPIIQPCNCNLRWSRNGTVIKEEKVKYFTDEDYELYCAQFLYIDQLSIDY